MRTCNKLIAINAARGPLEYQAIQAMEPGVKLFDRNEEPGYSEQGREARLGDDSGSELQDYDWKQDFGAFVGEDSN